MVDRQGEARQLFENRDRLRSADLDTLRRRMTLLIRKERFVGGHLLHMLGDRHILAILRRLREIERAME